MKKTIFVIAVASVLLAACGSMASQVVATEAPAYGYGGGAPAYPMEGPLMPAGTAAPDYARQADALGGGNAAAASVERLVIQNASLSVVVADPEAKVKAIEAMAEEMGGYVVSTNVYQTSTQGGVVVPEAQITVRVPAEKLNDALDEIKADAVEVQSESRSGEDVTAAYVDLQSRLQTYEDAEAQLRKILEEQSTSEEVVNIFNQMMYYREQIELIKGQMKYYEEAAALSAVSVTVVAEETIQPLEVLGWEPQGTARDAVQNLIYFFQDFVDFLIWFVLNFLPKLLMIALVFGAPIWLTVRAFRNAARRRKAKREAEEAKG
ncbi:MAG: DUF4349 domain-containing protein [Chloroflexota bacterium]